MAIDQWQNVGLRMDDTIERWAIPPEDKGHHRQMDHNTGEGMSPLRGGKQYQRTAIRRAVLKRRGASGNTQKEDESVLTD